MATALSAAQRHAMKEHVEQVNHNVGLRQWCVEQAVNSMNDHPGAQNPELVTVARAIHAFVTERPPEAE